MNFQEYQSQSKRTCSDLGGDKINLPHMVLGMNSEMNELEEAIANNDRVNISEELSDFQWYYANYCTFRGFLFAPEAELHDNAPMESTQNCIKSLYHLMSKLQDLVKKNMAYGKPISHRDENSILEPIQWKIKNIALNESIDIFKGLENNINKLKLRYPDKFSEERAINRDTDAERRELEK